MKKKRFAWLITAAMLVTSIMPISASAASVGVTINGSPVAFTESSGSPFIDASSRTQVPLRATMEAYGCDVSWDNSSRSAVVKYNGKTVTVPVGSNTIKINGNTVKTDTAAQIVNGRTYLPIRPVLEAVGGYVSWDNASSSVTVDSYAPIIKVHFLDVGQGDSILIDSGETEMLIDASVAKMGSTVVSDIKPLVDGDLDFVVATHPDADHIGGMGDVFDAFEIGTVIDSGCPGTTQTYNNYVSKRDSEGCVHTEDDDFSVSLGNGAFVKFIETGDTFTNPNDSSVVCELVYGNCKVLFTGDMSESIERINLSKFEDVDILKVGHHGSSSSSCDDFLNIVRPEYAVASYSVGNSYGHPHIAALTRLFNHGSKVLGTGKSGDITLTTNGKAYNFDKSNYLVKSDAGNYSPAPATTTTTPSQTGNSSGSNSGSSSSSSGSSSTVVPDTSSSNNITATYIGNKNTGVFHESTCSSVSRMSAKNKVTLSSRDAAIAAGYRPCNRCNP